MLDKFGLTNCRGSTVPIPPGLALQITPVGNRDEGEDRGMQFVSYQELVGSLFHLANTTRPDIAFATSLLSRFMKDPRQVQWRTAKHVLRYLKETRKHGIVYQKTDTLPLHGYTDSDFAGDRLERKSVSGFVFISNKGAVTWRSRKQDVVAESTLEAEYIAMSFAVREAIWLRRMFAEFGILDTNHGTLKLYGDNQGSIKVARNDVCNERSKHIDVRYHFTRHHVQNGTICLQYVPTNNMIADIMTKALAGKKHSHFLTGMGVSGAQAYG